MHDIFSLIGNTNIIKMGIIDRTGLLTVKIKFANERSRAILLGVLLLSQKNIITYVESKYEHCFGISGLWDHMGCATDCIKNVISQKMRLYNEV